MPVSPHAKATPSRISTAQSALVHLSVTCVTVPLRAVDDPTKIGPDWVKRSCVPDGQDAALFLEGALVGVRVGVAATPQEVELTVIL